MSKTTVVGMIRSMWSRRHCLTIVVLAARPAAMISSFAPHVEAPYQATFMQPGLNLAIVQINIAVGAIAVFGLPITERSSTSPEDNQ